MKGAGRFIAESKGGPLHSAGCWSAVLTALDSGLGMAV